MRSLLLVKNKRGEIKFSHYSNTETAPDADIAYLTDFIKHGDKLIALENSLKKMAFFATREQARFMEKLIKGNKKATEYYNDFLDPERSVDILENFITMKRRSYKCYRYKYTDFLFLDILYELDLHSKMFRYTQHGETIRIMHKEIDDEPDV